MILQVNVLFMKVIEIVKITHYKRMWDFEYVLCTSYTWNGNIYYRHEKKLLLNVGYV